MKTDRPKSFTFIIRGLQWTTVIERMFHVENDKDRDEWCEAITLVAGRLSVEEEGDVEMIDENKTQDEYRNRLHITTRPSSRGRKIVCEMHSFYL
jgi:RAC serine/threonine-protein kinase